MFKGTVLCIPRSEAVRHAAQILSELGICVTRKCAPDVTHVLLPVPSFSNGDEYLAHFLTELPDDVIISGGNLHSPLLEHYRRVDFLQDPYYLAENAAITADCALEIIEKEIPETCNVLVLGWGRIGKCLSQLLRCKGFEVTIAVRKSADLAMIRALGGRADAAEDTLTVWGTGLTGGCVDSFNDHRIAMSAAIAATVCTHPVTISGANCVEKSYPRFWEEYKHLGGQYEQHLR